MTDDLGNPFNIPERTIIRPNPGGKAGSQPASPAPEPAPPRAASPSFGTSVDLPPVSGIGKLAASARPLLAMIAWLRTLSAHPDIEGLRNRLVQELDRFRLTAQRSGIQDGQIRDADYILAASLDDVIANTPWGAGAAWPRRSLTLQRHNDATGGDRVFKLLEDYKRDPGARIGGLELIYFALTLGFEGRLRISAQGRAELSQLRDGLYRTLRQTRGDRYRELSAMWKPASAGRREMRRLIPIWALGVIALSILTSVFLVLSFFLNGVSDQTYESLATLPPHNLVQGAPSPVPYSPPPPSAESLLNSLQRFLAPEINQGLVVVLDSGRNVIIRIVARGMFESGSASIDDRFSPLLARIAAALTTTSGPVIVTGHTDSQPVRSLKYPSNFELSAARAESVKLILGRDSGVGDRISAEGRADTEPVATNATSEGRQQNRRIEILVSKAGTPQ